MNKIHEYNILGINIQIIVTIVVVILGILTFFSNRFMPFFQMAMAIDLILFAYQNEKVFHRKNLTIIYLVCGILLLIFSCLLLLGVI